jgi:glycosyltransferase involved in cell wall biosynthesis
MRIGVDATCWPHRRGYGRFTRALLTEALKLDQKNQYTFFVDHDSAEFPLPNNVEVCRVAMSVPTIQAAGAHSSRSIADLWTMAQAMRNAPIDLIYFPSAYSFVPLFPKFPVVVTIHDAIPEMFPELVFPTFRSRFLYRLKKRLAIGQSRLIATVSEYSRRCLVEQLGIRPERLRVVSEAADPVFQPLGYPTAEAALTRWGVPSTAKCLIFVGGFSPHKNLSMLLGIVKELIYQEDFSDLRLLLVGDYEGDPFNSCYGELAEQVRVGHLEGHVIFTGHLEDKDLLVLLNRADALVLPSFCEGFGLPGVEAAACGVPVIATTESPLPQLLGAGALAVDPGDRAGWLRAIERVLTDAELRGVMRQAALSEASRLSWKNSARQLLGVFDEVEREDGASA